MSKHYASVTNITLNINEYKEKFRTDTPEGLAVINVLDRLIEDLNSNPNKNFEEMANAIGFDIALKEQLEIVNKEIKSRKDKRLHVYYVLEVKKDKKLLMSFNLKEKSLAPELMHNILTNMSPNNLPKLNLELHEKRVEKADYLSVVFYTGDGCHIISDHTGGL